MSEPVIIVDFNEVWSDGDGSGVIARSYNAPYAVGTTVLAQDCYEDEMRYRATVVRRDGTRVWLQCSWDAVRK